MLAPEGAHADVVDDDIVDVDVDIDEVEVEHPRIVSQVPEEQIDADAVAQSSGSGGYVGTESGPTLYLVSRRSLTDD